MAERGLRARVKVGTLGKVKTALQMVSIVLLLLVNPGGRNVEVDIVSSLMKAQAEEMKLLVMAAGMGALIASAAAATVSGVQYFAAALPLLLATDNSNSTVNTATTIVATSTESSGSSSTLNK